MRYLGENAIRYHEEEYSWIPDIGYVRTCAGYVTVNGVRHDILPKALDMFKNRYGKDYVESLEYFAHQIFIQKSIPNDGYFSE